MRGYMRMSAGGSYRAVYHSMHHRRAVICIMIVSDFSAIFRRFDFSWTDEVLLCPNTQSYILDDVTDKASSISNSLGAR